MNKLKPEGITANRQTAELVLLWNDGHESIYPYTILRYACPCAECRGGHENMGSEPDPEIFSMRFEDTPATRIKDIKLVGAYAVTIEWEDEHDYGIYTWEYLRKLCPCLICRPGILRS